jgi:hypothetical protein
LEKYRVLSAILIMFFLSAGCDQKTTLDFRNENVTATITLLTFQGNAEASWAKDSAGKIYAKSRTITFTGTCSRNIKSLVIKVDSVTSSTPPTCAKDTGDFSWSHSFGADLTSTIEFIPVLLADGNESPTNTLTKTIVVDTVAPADPAITTNGGANINISVPTVTLNGTTSADTNSVTTNDLGTLSLNTAADTFQLDTSLTVNQTKTISFTAYDLAGNASGSVSIQVTYVSAGSILLKVADFSGTGISAPITNGNVKLISVTSSPILTATPVTTSSPDNLKHYHGVTNVSARNP